MTDQASVLLHPVRLRVVQALIGRELTTRELGEHLPAVPPATLYRQVKTLAEAGIIEVVATHQVRGRTERTYGLVADAAHLGVEAASELGPDEHVRYLQVFVAALLEQGVRYLHSDGADPGRDGFGYRQVALWLDDDELAAVATELSEVVGRYTASSAGDRRRRRTLTTVLIPDPSGAGRGSVTDP